MSDKSTIYVDADACPVKDEVLKVAIRHETPIYYVANAFMRLPEDRLVNRVVVPEGPDVADDWIAEHLSLIHISEPTRPY